MLYLAAVFWRVQRQKVWSGRSSEFHATPYIVFHATMILSLELGAPEIKGLKGQWGSENQ